MSRPVASGPACHGRAREACGVSSSVTGATALAPDTAQFGGQPGEFPGLPAAPLAGAIDRPPAEATAPLPGRRVVGIRGVEAVTVLAAVLGRIAVTRRCPAGLRLAKAVTRDQAAQHALRLAPPHAVGLAGADRVGQAFALHATDSADGDGGALALLGVVEERVVVGGGGVAAGGQLAPAVEGGHGASPP